MGVLRRFLAWLRGRFRRPRDTPEAADERARQWAEFEPRRAEFEAAWRAQYGLKTEED